MVQIARNNLNYHTALGREGNTYARLGIGPAPALPAIQPREADSEATPEVTALVVADGDRRPAIAVTNKNFINQNNTKFKYVPQPMDTPAATEYVVGNYEPQRADVLEAEDFELTKGNWVEDAHAEITKMLAQLRRVIALDNADASAGDQRFANDQRQRIFTDIKAQIRTVFGPDSTDADGDPINTGVLAPNGAGAITNDAWTAHVDYPVNSAGVAQDQGVLAQVQDVLAAFADREAFADAFGSGGLFEDQKGNNADRFTAGGNSYPAPGAIFDRARGKLSVAARATDYTRFGGWSHQVSDFAAAALAAQSYDGDPVAYTEDGDSKTSDRARGKEFGAFAYSPLDPVAPYRADSRLYPAQTADVTATYAGRTAAAQGDLFYTGAVEAKVFWDASDVEMSRVTVEISELEDTVNGDPLQFGYAGSDPENDDHLLGVVDVESLMWTAMVDNDGTVTFASDADVTVAVNDVDGAPNWRPNPGAGTLLENHPQVRGNSGSGVKDPLWYKRTDDSGTHDYAYALPSGDPYGALTFGRIHTAVAAGDNVGANSGNDYDAEEAVFEAGQMADSLAFPTHLVGGPVVRNNANAQGGASGTRGTGILLFADGSTRHLDLWSDLGMDNDRGLINARNAAGEINSPQSVYDTSAAGTPLPDELVFNDIGLPWSKDFSHADVPGTGAPAMTPGQLAAAFLRANDYVNVTMEDPTARAATLDGMFVGADQDGPLGLIGTWSLTGGAFGVGVERGPIRGAFGADIQP